MMVSKCQCEIARDKAGVVFLCGYGRLSFRHLELQNLSTGDDFILLVPLFTTMGVMALLKNYPILSGRLIWSFRHIELQNPSIISDFSHRERMVRKKSEK